MKNWTVRTRIIGAFAAVIAIMLALGAMSYTGLRTIRAQAGQIERDVLPGVVVSAQSQSLARELLLAVTSHSAASSAQARQLSADSIESLLRIAAQQDEAYSATIIDEGDRKLFGAMRDARSRFERAYRDATIDKVLTDDELRTALRPPLEEYVKLSDSLFDLNRSQGNVAATEIAGSVNKSLWTLGPALFLATLIAIICSALLVNAVMGLIR
ncbi:MAG TPA: MCP four helix bundle domain-containing protein, partial [Gemmatimonadaceae bacterium]|nr:MCP four helix bundle domain-containing protein [Gemmatimonadaceae bacterium]